MQHGLVNKDEDALLKHTLALETDVFFEQNMLSPVTQISASESTSSEGDMSSSFYDYLLNSSNSKDSSKFHQDFYEVFNFSNQSSLLSDELRGVLPGYTLLSNISNDLYRGFNNKTKRSVIIKYASYVSAGTISRFYNEWYSLSGLNTEPYDVKRPRTLPRDMSGILYPCDWVALDDYKGLALVYEDILNLKSFKEVFVMGLVKDEKRLMSAVISCLKTLEKVHKMRFTHNGLTASNLLINDNNEVYITGWDFCFSYSTEDCTRGYRTLNKRYLIDWLPYMAPEASGEVNRLADRRADLYSIGVILYQMICCSLPFIASDGRELINKHIKETPRAPSEFGAAVNLSNIIMKLLEKDSFARYQSCSELVVSLRAAISDPNGASSTQENKDTTPLTLETSPRYLYGREKDIEFLKSLYTSFEDGVHLTLIKGPTGVGKTRLVSEIQTQIVSNNHFFAHWKCNSMTTGFASFMAMLNTILHQIMSGSEEQITNVRESILKVIGSMDPSPLFAHLPELKDILGPNYEKLLVQYMKLNGRPEAIRPGLRFRHILKCLFIALGQSFPLTLFFDDFQWFSVSDLELLNEIRIEILKESWKSTIIILATSDTTDQKTFDEFQKRLSCDFVEYTLENTDLKPYQLFFQDLLVTKDGAKKSVSEQEVYELAAMVYEKVEHNALRALLIMGQARYDNLFDLNDVNFVWETALAKLSALPSDIYGLYSYRLKTFFNDDEVNLLKYAACVHDNTAFSLLDLATASNRPVHDVCHFMSKCIEYGLMFPMNIFYKFPFHLMERERPFGLSTTDVNDLASLALFSLYHDTLYTFVTTVLMSPDENMDYQKTVGLRCAQLKDVYNEKHKNYCLVVANHFAKSYKKVNNNEEAAIYLKVLSKAVRYCFKIYDIYPALTFLKVSQAIMEKHGAGQQKLFTTQVEIIRCMVKTSDYQGAIECIRSKPQEFQNDPRVVIVTIRALSALGNIEECVDLGLNCLRRNGIFIEKDTQKMESQTEELKKLAPKNINELQDPFSANRLPAKDVEILHEIMSEVLFVSFHFGEMSMASVIAHQLIQHSLKYGFSGYAALAFVVLAMEQASNNSMKFAKEISQFTFHVLKTKWISANFCNRVLFLYSFSIGCYLESAKELTKLYDLYSDSFSQVRSSFSLGFIMQVSLRPYLEILDGRNIERAYNTVFHTTRKIDLENDVNRYWYKCVISLFRINLNMPYEEKYDVDKEKDFSIEDQSFPFKCLYYFYKNNIISISQPQLWSKKVNSEELSKLLENVPLNIWSPNFNFRRIHSHLDDKHIPTAEKRNILQKYLNIISQCKVYSPDLFEAKLLCQKAELLRLDKASDLEILDAYQESLDASEGVSIVDYAIINGRVAKWLYLGPKSKKRASRHFQSAVRSLQEVGLKRVAVSTKESFPECFENFQLVSKTPVRPQNESAGGSLPHLNQLISSVLGGDDEYLFKGPEQDTSNIFKAIEASLAISVSMNTESIIENLIHETLSMLDADYAIVAIRDEETLAIEFKAVGGSTFINHVDPEESARLVLPQNLMRECIERGITLQNFSEGERTSLINLMKSDMYFCKAEPQSLLCMPIKNEVETIGALYLEKVTTAKPFSPKEVGIAEMLCTQAAFALDKARLYYRTMLAKKAAEEATEDKAAFLANMSHEIRTPFNSLFACAGFLLDTKLDALQQEYVETILSSSKVTLNIIDAILTFSKIEHGSIKLENELFSINECIESSMQLIAEQAAAKNIELTYFNRCGNADMIKGDVIRFKQIIINLLGNAVKFTLEGSIVIKSTATRLTQAGVFEFVISIKDSGIGIPANSQTKVFGAFSQVDGSSRRVYGGSGLGLAISKKLVELMGGELTFESTEGEGTTFFLSATFCVTEQEPALKTTGMGEKVLIVNEDSFTTQSLRENLQEKRHCDVTVVDNCTGMKSLNQYYLIFINPKHLSTIETDPTNVIKEESLVLISAYGVKFEQRPGHQHPVLLLPFSQSKLSAIFELVSHGDTIVEPKRPVRPSRPLGEEIPLKILIVEDNMINTKVAIQHLKKLGYTADSAIHGVEALEMCAAKIDSTGSNYDVILMDIQMPLKDGIETSKDLRRLYGNSKSMPVIIALTANVETEDRDRCISCGMSDFISKPILPNVLSNALRSAGTRLIKTL